ncbi:hypothetical protein BJV78DRAFT_1179064 [Lactifluus subvellereus]|nr:hypothetical protein BJV78DRAFT_1179064 [Lactifluus subvellereus]
MSTSSVFRPAPRCLRFLRKWSVACKDGMPKCGLLCCASRWFARTRICSRFHSLPAVASQLSTCFPSRMPFQVTEALRWLTRTLSTFQLASSSTNQGTWCRVCRPLISPPIRDILIQSPISSPWTSSLRPIMDFSKSGTTVPAGHVGGRV